MIRAANGRWARYYLPTPPRVDMDGLAVTYHKRVKGKLRQLSISPKLMRKVLR
jgi:hypothetical protein